MRGLPYARIPRFFDAATSTVSYVVYEACGGECAIIDPVLDYDAAAGRISTQGAEKIVAFVQAHDLKVQWLLETHAHADHLSASAYLRNTLGGRIGIGAPITQVQSVFRDIYNLEPEFKLDGSQFSRCSSPTKNSVLATFTCGHCMYPGTPRPTWPPAPGRTQQPCLSATRCSCPTSKLTPRCDFPGAMRNSCISRSGVCWPLRRRRACSCA